MRSRALPTVQQVRGHRVSLDVCSLALAPLAASPVSTRTKGLPLFPGPFLRGLGCSDSHIYLVHCPGSTHSHGGRNRPPRLGNEASGSRPLAAQLSEASLWAI